ncbi:diguanylate cyclase [Rheinheimera sp. WS51]|uniref:diguanylate cyclase n=1 Tax=Rheinheimera sp. WS51 TaxID=3425886 RepID=UPI003D92EB7B
MSNELNLSYLQSLDDATILVVDDQPINIQVIYQILGDQYQILMATSGPEAIKVCKKSMPDLVLLDVVMPEQDGLTTCKKMKLDPDIANIPIIFVTGLQQQSEENACWEAGAVDFIQKPVNPSTLINRVKAHLLLKKQSDLLRSFAYVDGLTGVYNRRFFDQYLANQIAVCKRLQQPIAVMIIDIDYFKKYNDHLGHLAGDDALKLVAQRLKAVSKRPADLVARYGGEEFICVLPNTDISGASHLAEKMLTGIRELDIEHPTSPLGQVTVSIGVAATTDYKVNLTQLADEQLYLAKQQGRNRLCYAP